MSTLSLAPVFAPAPARARSTVRLTRRGRLVVFLTSLFLVLAVAFMLAGGAVGTGEPGQQTPTEIVQVAPGDTLWGIASDIATDGDVRSMMKRDRAAQRPRVRRPLSRPEAPRPGRLRLTREASISRFDPGWWNQGEDRGAGPAGPPLGASAQLVVRRLTPIGSRGGGTSHRRWPDRCRLPPPDGGSPQVLPWGWFRGRLTG